MTKIIFAVYAKAMETSPTPEESSRSLVDPLSETERSALDMLYKQVADPRIEELLIAIGRLKQELAQKDEILEQELAKKDVIITRMKHGNGLYIRDVWEDYKYRNKGCKLRMDPIMYAMKLDVFLSRIVESWGHLKAAHDVFRVAAASDANVGISDSIEPRSMQHASAYTRRLAA